MLYAFMQNKLKESCSNMVDRHENFLPFQFYHWKGLDYTVHPLSAGAIGSSTPLPPTVHRPAHPQDELLSIIVVEEAGQLVRKLAVDPLSNVRHLQLLVHLQPRQPWYRT